MEIVTPFVLAPYFKYLSKRDINLFHFLFVDDLQYEKEC